MDRSKALREKRKVSCHRRIEIYRVEVMSEEGDRKEEPSLLSVTGNIGDGRQELELDIKNYSPGANPVYKQVSGRESVKQEQGKVVGIVKIYIAK